MEFAVFYFDAAAADIRHADAEAAVLQRAGDTGFGVALQNRAHCVKCFDQRGGFVCDLSVGQNLTRTDAVEITELKRRHADHFRELVDVALGSKAALRDTEAAECAARRVVGIVGVALDVHVLIVIGTRRVRAGALQHRAAEGGVCAAVRDDAVFVAGGGEIHLHRVAFRGNLKALRARKANLDRTLEQVAGECRMVLHAHVLFAAEAAADHHRGHANLFGRKSQHHGAFFARLIHALIAAKDMHAVAFDFSNRAFRFEKRVIGKRHAIVVCDHMCAVFNDFVRVAALDALEGEQVILAL